jgi:serine/threonine protein kinase
METDEIKALRKIKTDFLTKVIQSKTNKKYTVSKILACGEFSCVFLGLDEKNNWVAIKITNNKNKLEEVECLIKLKGICGENILCYIESFNINYLDIDWLVIITEFLPGYITMSEFMERYKISKSDLSNIISQIGETLNFIHKFGILHNDLHRENIMIDPKTLNIKIIDFGNCTSLYKVDDPNYLIKLELDSIKELFI